MTADQTIRARRISTKRWVVSILAALVLVYAVVLGALYLFQRTMIFPSNLISAEHAGMALDQSFERITVTTADGETLKAFWKPPVGDAPVLLVFHGNADIPQTYAARFGAGPWAEAGYGVMAIAYRGYPGSSGETSETGIIADAVAAREAAMLRAPGHDLVFYGHSLGTGVATALSEMFPSLGLYLEAPYTSIVDMVAIQAPFAPSFLVRDPLRSDERIGQSRAAAILISHGADDQAIPVSYGRTLASRNPRAVFRAVPGAGHQTILGVSDVEAIAAFAAAR